MLAITEAEYRARCERLLEHLQAQGLNGVVLYDRDYIMYYSGFAFIPTERPIAFVMNAKGQRGLFVPRLEVEHAQMNALIDQVAHYAEYPDDPHPVQVLVTLLGEMGISGPIGSDDAGYPWILGYRGPDLAEVAPVTVTRVRAFIEDQMRIKTAAELDLLHESCRWAHLALRLLQRYTRPGLTETEVEKRASAEATFAMVDAIGPIHKGQSMLSAGAYAIYRGQIGRNAAIPHALASNITFQPGDVLVGESTAPIWGYVCELERTFVLGTPTADQQRFFNHMLALQDTAFDALQTARICADVDKAVRAYYDKHDLNAHWRHHTGHAIGLRYHESPYLDRGDRTELQPGMVFTVEPGLYHPQLGGFRHSDMVRITDSGMELMTWYPRDLDSLTIPL